MLCFQIKALWPSVKGQSYITSGNDVSSMERYHKEVQGHAYLDRWTYHAALAYLSKSSSSLFLGDCSTPSLWGTSDSLSASTSGVKAKREFKQTAADNYAKGACGAFHSLSEMSDTYLQTFRVTTTRFIYTNGYLAVCSFDNKTRNVITVHWECSAGQ